MNTETTQTPDPTGEVVEFEAIDRSSFLLKGAMAAGALYGAAAIGPMVNRALGQSSDGDVDILNFALTLELLEADFYDQAVKNVKLSSELKKLATEIGDNEQDHVDALTGAVKKLGGKPVATPTFTFPLKDEKSFLDLAVTFEDTGVSAYNGAGPLLKSKDLLATAGSIVQIEGRHAAAVRFMAGLQPVVEAFDVPLEQAKVEKAVAPFIKS